MSKGFSIAQFPPFWEVVVRLEEGKKEYIVVDTSPRLDGGLPVRVFGPDTKGICLEWAAAESLIYLTVKGAFLTD